MKRYGFYGWQTADIKEKHGLTPLLLEIPINLLLNYFTHTGAAAQLPFIAGAILVGVSVFLTFIAGLIPSSLAAKKDPVEALRTEKKKQNKTGLLRL